MRYTICLLILLMAGSYGSYAGKKGKVWVVPALHWMYRQNTHYNYDSLIANIKRYNPDIIAVEIRAEDMKEDSAYLKKNYPYEMWMMRNWFPGKTVVGFDWLGEDINGKPIPEGYLQKLAPVKVWETEMRKDSKIMADLAACDSFKQQRIKLLTSLTLDGLLHSNDPALTQAYYQCFGDKLKGTIHYRVAQYYRDRDGHLLSNLKSIINANRKRRILILTGDDHYPYLKELNK